MTWNLWTKRTAWLAGLAGAYWALIFTLTHLPSSGGGGRYGADKVAHFLAYLGLAALLTILAVTWRGLSLARLAVVWLMVAGYGVLDELSQSLVPGRTSSFADWLADACGGLVGVAIVAVTCRFLSRKPLPPDIR